VSCLDDAFYQKKTFALSFDQAYEQLDKNCRQNEKRHANIRFDLFGIGCSRHKYVG